jgi:hypothetical protein
MIFGELHSLHVRVWTASLSWRTVARRRPRHPRSPKDRAYHWPKSLGRAIHAARKAGIEPVLNLTAFPRWANGNRSEAWAPLHPRDFADFAAAAVKRYPQVRRWLIVSEPGNFYNFRPQGDHGRRAPQLYAQLLDAAYASMHAVRRNVVVIGGNVHPYGLNDQYTTAPDTFLQNMVLPNGKRPRLDLFGINPYTERPLDLSLKRRPLRVDFDDLDWLGGQLDRLWPDRHVKIFIDEFGWNTEHEALGWLYYVSRKQQVKNLRRAFSLARKLHRIDTFCWFQLYDSPPKRNRTQWLNWTTGLRTYKGKKKPSWWAFRKVPSGPHR